MKELIGIFFKRLKLTAATGLISITCVYLVFWFIDWANALLGKSSIFNLSFDVMAKNYLIMIVFSVIFSLIITVFKALGKWYDNELSSS